MHCPGFLVFEPSPSPSLVDYLCGGAHADLEDFMAGENLVVELDSSLLNYSKYQSFNNYGYY